MKQGVAAQGEALPSLFRDLSPLDCVNVKILIFLNS